ncbi:MAG TPA: SDR family NAD(P)-dependent oxidoreductase [Chloroflexus aurantiacus]|jgi:NAD(P)-dependent dehydrogenase (short-subunit alcohol dehydrogenase family)|uniref:Short-chain dehydrogenase/reductase SDR n=1 Tax=Chloroflexus aurantiacus (strain ATCC 29366 / DSM 635 / J-10-fl) TaxID=324602 RepID=A9WDM1_CHLAA|nr:MULTISPECIES: SDR family oxidoreductase [Chloroflexus]ABY33627.1 short-chain dehydrogenase/reductase SDR [Chloroflexus aurantiacus J-10-fl]RMG52585.1 MAG: SDR family oxidoreductase [Chloroflexota bacterium]GIV95263.1 MAG: short-chain dehydrogenase [Chloroflexus sp.]HBW67777.1 SDR family NAD(P)-dependent oxidoreductase [Chloroflexus aurantiacus]
MKVKNKVFVVTGGASGLGRELVLRLLDMGANVAAVDINGAALDELVGQAGQARSKLSTHVVNIADLAAVQALPEKVLSVHGAVDGLINNAGIIQPFVKVNDLEDAAIDRVLKVNFYGTLYMTKSFLPYLIKRPVAHIVNISSMGALVPVPGQTMYGASKAAVKLFTEGLRSELLNTNVRVTIVFPGAMATDIVKNSNVAQSSLPMQAAQAQRSSRMKALSPKEAARIIIDGIEGDRYRILVGSDARMMDWLSRLNPRWAAELIYRQMQHLLSR